MVAKYVLIFHSSLMPLHIYKNNTNSFIWLLNTFIDEVGTPSAPELVADSLTATSLSLEWEVPERLRRLTRNCERLTENYLVQWRYEEVAGDWTFCRNQSMGHNSTIRVDNLQPFTKYRVSVELWSVDESKSIQFP